MKAPRIYVVCKGDENQEIIGVFDKPGLKKYLSWYKKTKGKWSLNYSIDEKGQKKFWCRVRSYHLDDTIQVTSFPFNKEDYGTMIKWKTFKGRSYTHSYTRRNKARKKQLLRWCPEAPGGYENGQATSR